MKRVSFFLLMFIVNVTAFENNCLAQKSSNAVVDDVIFNGNTFSRIKKLSDTTYMTNPVTDTTLKVIRTELQPVKVNGKPIYEVGGNAKAPLMSNKLFSLEKYILDTFANLEWVKALDDGIVQPDVKNIVIDDNGKVIYYDIYGIRYLEDQSKINSELAGEKLIARLLSSLVYDRPPVVNGKKTVVRLNTCFKCYTITIKDHKTAIINRNLFARSNAIEIRK